MMRETCELFLCKMNTLLKEQKSSTMVGIFLFHTYSLVENFEAGLTHTHLLLNAKFGNGRVLRRALPTENLPTCPAVVLNEEPPAVMHQKNDLICGTSQT